MNTDKITDCMRKKQKGFVLRMGDSFLVNNKGKSVWDHPRNARIALTALIDSQVPIPTYSTEGFVSPGDVARYLIENKIVTITPIYDKIGLSEE